MAYGVNNEGLRTLCSVVVILIFVDFIMWNIYKSESTPNSRIYNVSANAKEILDH